MLLTRVQKNLFFKAQPSGFLGFIGLFWIFRQAVIDDVKWIGKIINETYCLFLQRKMINYLYILESYITFNYAY